MNYHIDRLDFIHLSRCRYAGRAFIRKWIELDPELKKIYQISSQELSKIIRIPQKKAQILLKDLHNTHLKKKILAEIREYHIITLVDEYYPNMLNTIKDAPLVLYGAGNPDLLKKQPALSVIGTRNPSNEAFRKLNFAVTPLIDANWVIVSGMARGIDSMAHRLTLERGGNTIAVLGSGFHSIYPREHIPLYQQIAKDGLVLSEYPPDQPPQKYHFPERNRIISGLTMGTLVIEAMKKSGTMITVDQALDQGRDVFAVPGSPLLKQCTGCNELIQNGAKLIQSAEDIYTEWNYYFQLFNK
ncbi:DNA-processing protein DprA [Oceanobacillus neutriphilus]|uniref:DNA processing protein DprA n=1 Tax=Oceanobacillus neutriphilus TaxID=531815 RepID=A0ABQ2NWU9_9BACI|nr:DNA-processing protein DprA [Oceanobacillus neutriphilus]GGP12341.1 DNA processing protein DprA [Oceanobacillus neutriphilus]